MIVRGVNAVTAVLAGLFVTVAGLVSISLVTSSPAQAFAECSVTGPDLSPASRRGPGVAPCASPRPEARRGS